MARKSATIKMFEAATKNRNNRGTAAQVFASTLSDKGVLRSGGAGHAIFTDRSGQRIDLADKTTTTDKVSKTTTPLGTVFYNDDLLGVMAYVKCSYTSFALYDKERGFYYTRLLLRVTDKDILDQVEKGMRHMMTMEWCNNYCKGNVRFPWGFLYGDFYDLRKMSGELKRLDKQEPIFWTVENGLFGLGDQYLYRILDLTSFKKNVKDAKEQIELLQKEGLMIEGDTFVYDKHRDPKPYVGMLTGNYMWLPKGTLYGFNQRDKKQEALEKNALFYEMDTCVLLGYQTDVVKKTQAEMLKGKPTEFTMRQTYREEERPSKGWRILLNIVTCGLYAAGSAIAESKYSRTDSVYEEMVKVVESAINKLPINTDISGNIKFWVRRSELFLEGQDIHYQTDEQKGGVATTDNTTAQNKKMPWLVLGGLLLSKFSN